MGKAIKEKTVISAKPEKPEKHTGRQQETIQADQAQQANVAGKANRQDGRQSGSRQAIHLLIIFDCFLAYSNTFHGPFQWDEARLYRKQPFIRVRLFYCSPPAGGACSTMPCSQVYRIPDLCAELPV